jgi:hypothetical protein
MSNQLLEFVNPTDPDTHKLKLCKHSFFISMIGYFNTFQLNTLMLKNSAFLKWVLMIINGELTGGLFALCLCASVPHRDPIENLPLITKLDQ